MDAQRTKRIVAFCLSFVGHALIVVALTFSVSLSSPVLPTMGVVVPIETVMVDEAVLDARDARIEAERQAALRRQQEETRQRQIEAQRQQARAEAEEQAKIQLQAEQRAEAERQAQLEEDRRQQEAEEAARAEAERQAELQREREEAERRRVAEEAARLQEQIAADIAAGLAAERQAQEAVNSGARDQWAAMISNKVQRSWQRPPNATAGLECTLVVEQVITGDVRSVTVSECNVSDANIIRSLENAVRAASPLPARPAGVEFERILRIRFKPTD
jgi:colicin import membrane protein